jgi:quinate dehydrogenase (quinone)
MDKSPNPPPLLSRLWLVLLGAVIALAGLFFAIGGGKLVSLGGSWYFLLAGIGLVISGVLIIMRRPLGGLLFGLIFVLSVIWAVWDAGFEFWPLISRLLAISIGATVVALTYPLLRKASGRAPAYVPSFLIAAVLAIASAGGVAGMFVPHPTVAFSGTPSPLVPVDPAKEQKNWEAYGNTAGGSRFAALDQITRDNVKNLTVAWTYHTGDTPISPTAPMARKTSRHRCRSATRCSSAPRITTSSPSTPIPARSSGRTRSTQNRPSGCAAAVWPISMRPRLSFSRPFRRDAGTAAVVAEGAPCQRRLLMKLDRRAALRDRCRYRASSALTSAPAAASI